MNASVYEAELICSTMRRVTGVSGFKTFKHVTGIENRIYTLKF